MSGGAFCCWGFTALPGSLYNAEVAPQKVEGHLSQSETILTHCPVCDSTSIRKNNLLDNGLNQTQPELLSYRCSNGHIFYVQALAKSASQSE